VSAKKAKSKRPPSLAVVVVMRLIALVRSRTRTLLLTALIAAAFFGLWYAVWQRVGQGVLSSEPYWLSQQNVEITPLPEWIHRDIRAEVFRDASLDGPLSIMDDDLTARIANAFSLHPWVAKVRRVSKHHPARVEAELVYRRPVLMVPRPGELLPVDEQGVLLPREDFSPVEARRYPRLQGIDTAPIGPEGTRWGDARVFGGAQIAAAFGPAWHQLRLDCIVPVVSAEMGYGHEYTYRLFTRGGTEIRWGRPPGMETPGEALAADKMTRLLKHLEENGSLEGPKGPQQLDVRRPGPLNVAMVTRQEGDTGCAQAVQECDRETPEDASHTAGKLPKPIR
jgi:hypothetical protein